MDGADVKYIAGVFKKAVGGGAQQSPLQSLYRTFINNPNLCIVEFELRGNEPFITRSEGDIKSITGYSASELKGQSLFSVVPISSDTDFDQILKDLDENGFSIKHQLLINKDGDTVSTLGIVVRVGDKYVEYLVNEDIIR